MGDTGLEQSAFTHPKTAISEDSGAKCGALDDRDYPALIRLIQAWPRLPEQAKTKIRGSIAKHSTQGRGGGERSLSDFPVCS